MLSPNNLALINNEKNFSFSLSLEEQKIQENDNNENKFTISHEFTKFGARKF